MSQPKYLQAKCSPCNTCNSNQMSNDLPHPQQTDCTSFQVESQSSLGNIIESYKVKIIEKDRVLFDYARNLKEAEKMLDSLRKANESKDDANAELKEQLSELTPKLKRTEALLMQKTEESSQAKAQSDQRAVVLAKENDTLTERTANLQQVIAQQDERLKKFIEENKCVKAEVNKLTSALDDKAVTLVKYEKLFDEFKKENKQIPSLKRQLADIEGIASATKNELNCLKSQQEKLQFEKEEAENKLQHFLSETQIEKEKSASLFKAQFEYERLKKQTEEKDKENAALIDKLKAAMKDNDSIVHIITSELGAFTTNLEGMSITTKGHLKLPISTLKAFSSSGLSNAYSLKYELITKSILLLRTKIVEIVNEAIGLIAKLNETHSSSEKDKQEIHLEKDALLKEMTVLKSTNKELVIHAKDKSNSLSALNESYSQLKETYLKVKASYSDVSTRLKKLTHEHNDFISQLKSKIDKRLIRKTETLTRYNSVDSVINPQLPSVTTVIVAQVNSIIEDNCAMTEQLQKTQAKEVSSFERIDQLETERKEVQDQIDSITQKCQIEINQLTYDKDMELKELKDTLYDKIKSLTELLEESNKLIQTYEGKNKKLESRNVKLEYNLQMLTNSHIELEKSINNSATCLQSAYDDKEAKYSSLLREIELKDIQVKAYEKLLGQDTADAQLQQGVMPNQIGKIAGSGTGIAPDFVKNDEHEKQLHLLMHSYNDEGSEINNTAQNSVHSPHQEMRIEDNEGVNSNVKSNTIDVENSLGGGFNVKRKSPGKIYSLKKVK